MLTVNSLVKTYRTKGGVTVNALDGVSVEFPEKGMVFLLGKSGSGKSTLLNVAGGLDAPDSGEVIVKGRSSRNFSAADFDSYRNTYIGFIFQEYNILSEFNVEQNISLALQLQGKKNDKDAVNAILEQVDLGGLGRRKPNTLSGGQKQRVAIARALIKEPEIIMADEPTGALDSNTGRQVFDTLKKLSRAKLVIVVSHDREFAEQYGDRIIELKDGKILSDTSKELAAPSSISENVTAIGGDTLKIKNFSKLSKTEMTKVMNMLKSSGDGEVIISSNAKDVSAFKRVSKITDEGQKEFFTDTKPDRIGAVSYDGSQTKFIKSRLPISRAAKMGASSLKIHPVRLIFTILIAVISFTLFGTVATMMTYDSAYSIANAVAASNYSTAALQKNYWAHYTNDYISSNDEKGYSYEYDTTSSAIFGKNEIRDLNVKSKSHGLNFTGIFQTSGSINLGTNLEIDSSDDYYDPSLRWMSDCGEDYLKECFGDGTRLAGEYPKDKTEIAISKYMYEAFNTYGYRKDSMSQTESINSYAELVGREVYLGGNLFKISGIYDVGNISGDYSPLKEALQNNAPDSQDERNSLVSEYDSVMRDSFHVTGFVTEDFYDAFAYVNIYSNSNQSSGYAELPVYLYRDYQYTSSAQFITKTDAANLEASGKIKVISYDGGSISVGSLSDDEAVISLNTMLEYSNYLMYSSKQIDDYTLLSFTEEFPDAFAAYGRLNNIKNWQTVSLPTDADVAIVVNAIKENWEEWVTGNPMYNASVAYDKMYCGESQKTMNIKGVMYSAADSSISNYTYFVLSMDFVKRNAVYWSYSSSVVTTKYVEAADSRYQYIMSPSNNSIDQSYFILDLGERDPLTDVTYAWQNTIYTQTSWITYMIETLSLGFLIAGLVTGVLASLFLFNFISASIAGKRNEVGVLRAVGARGTDVFKIFFSESLIITAICFVISAVAAGIVCFLINNFMMTSAFAIAMLNYGIIHILMILGVALVVSFIGTIIPVWLAARKAPVESIRAL